MDVRPPTSSAAVTAFKRVLLFGHMTSHGRSAARLFEPQWRHAVGTAHSRSRPARNEPSPCVRARRRAVLARKSPIVPV